MSNRFTALIITGGSGKRFDNLKKQYVKLSGIPIFIRSAYYIFNHPSIFQRIVVVPEGDENFVRDEMLEPFFNNNDVEITSGGETRQLSVYNGLVLAEEEYVIIHDGVRPLVDAETVDNCISVAIECGGAVVSIPVSDTVKQVKDGKISKTISRNEIYLAQTPQAFRKDVLRLAYEMAFRDDFRATDDSMVLEYAINQGYIDEHEVEIRVVIGSQRNIKITFPDDLLLAEFYINQIKNNIINT